MYEQERRRKPLRLLTQQRNGNKNETRTRDERKRVRRGYIKMALTSGMKKMRERTMD